MIDATLTLAPADLEVRFDRALSGADREALGESISNDPLLANFLHYVPHATPQTELLLAKAYCGEQLQGLGCVARIKKFKSTRLLAQKNRWWIAPLVGPMARQTSYMLDTAFLAYAHRTPFYFAPGADELAVRRGIVEHLQRQRDADGVWISEPAESAAWTAELGFECFSVLPMAQVDMGHHATVDAYIASLHREKRRAIRKIEAEFESGGGQIERVSCPGGVDPELLLKLLQGSAERSSLASPYGDLLNSPAAFRTQLQGAILVKVGGQIVAFSAYIAAGDTLYQCHGALDYDVSLKIRAYHRLLLELVRIAGELGFRRVNFGPLNNETKRRASNNLAPIVGCLWTRQPLFRPFTRRVIIPNLQVYTGPAPWKTPAGAEANGAPAEA